MLEEMYGEDYVKIEYYNGNTSMYFGDMVGYYGLNSSYSSLFPDIGDANPEDSFSGVPYEKGSQFMYWIESLLGKDAFQLFIRAYLEVFSQMVVNSPMLYEFYTAWVMDFFPDNATQIINLTDWDTWVYVPGVAPTLDADTFATTALTSSAELAQAYIEVYLDSGTPASPDSYLDYMDYLITQKVAFLQALRTTDGVDSTLLEYIDDDLSLTKMEVNPFVKKVWYQMGIEKGYEAVMEPCYVWMGEQGRYEFVSTTFRTLTEAGMCETAMSWYADYNTTYNSYVRTRVESYLEVCTDAGSPTELPDETSPPIDPTSAPSTASYLSTVSGVRPFFTVAVVGLVVWLI